ncbi:hypothetical protein HOY82DRAFT_490234 [Tuber indicum]|nr:hypothetical protein HOY82DRAFT_490234 [Tuber indicum]
MVRISHRQTASSVAQPCITPSGPTAPQLNQLNRLQIVKISAEGLKGQQVGFVRDTMWPFLQH